MAVFLVGYDLRHKHITDYKELFAAIEKVSNGDRWHCLDSTWLIEHPGPADTIWRSLVAHIHNADNQAIGDKLLVAKMTKDAQWTRSFSDACQAWLRAKLL